MLTPRRPPSFESLVQFVAFARRHGLSVHLGPEDPEAITVCCYVADYPIGKEELGRSFSTQMRQFRTSKGLAFATAVTTPKSQLCLTALDGHWRIWGNVAVQGNADFLDRLERLYQE